MERTKKFNKQEWSWIFYDWANSVWSTNISAAIFPIFFAMKASETGNHLYGLMVSVANLVVAVLAPFLGAIGDFKGMKKKLWIAFLLLGVAFTAVMGVVGSWQLMLLGYVISKIGFSGSCLFYDSFLTDVTTPERMDKVSTWGYAMGYIGGSTIPFVISIAIMLLMGQSDLSYRIAILIVPVWWLIFSIPLWVNVHQEYAVEDKVPEHFAGVVLRNVKNTCKDIFNSKVIFFFLLAYFFYIDGVNTVIDIATNYGKTLGLDTVGMILALLVTQIVAVPFSILFGKWSKTLGSKKLITISVAMYILITAVGFMMGFIVDYQYLFGLSEESAISISNKLFWVLATLVGTVQGGIQALSRSFFGQLIPPEKSNEYYGFLDIFGKFSCVIGPALYALVLSITGKASFAILSIVLLFILGLVFMRFVKEGKETNGKQVIS